MYRHVFKRLMDIMFSFLGIVVLAFPMLVVAIIIKIDSPGPALFKQKRIGIHKKTFTILKFRSMPISAPQDIPTHQLQNEKITFSKWQRFMRRFSIDELPQLFCIFVGTMSIVGPRPALWNQDDLVAERDKYGANDVKPGLTGWAQINGRDELPIFEKAKLDGDYTAALIAGRFHGFVMDVKCFFGTVVRVVKADGVIDGRMEQPEPETAEKKDDIAIK